MLRIAVGVFAGGVVLFATAADAPRSAAGILSAQNAGGYVVMSEPDSHPWVATFGSYLLCKTGDHAVTIKRVRYRTHVRPVDVGLVLREVGSDASVLVSAAGEPPDFVDPEGGTRHELNGAFKPLRAEQRIERSCEGPRYKHGFTELLFVVKADRSGAVIDQVRIDYVVGGYSGQYTIDLNGKMVLCGDAVGDDDIRAYCDDARSEG
ncbi:hypothetical protein [Streptomyces sp. KLOTTS4A1]|uniref:hypothetical protein n=1 Tax=Streptomyces sp. KLOTTS4A1 TaxID=3390996 RepID=UPI0039F530FC